MRLAALRTSRVLVGPTKLFCGAVAAESTNFESRSPAHGWLVPLIPCCFDICVAGFTPICSGRSRRNSLVSGLGSTSGMPPPLLVPQRGFASTPGKGSLSARRPSVDGAQVRACLAVVVVTAECVSRRYCPSPSEHLHNTVCAVSLNETDRARPGFLGAAMSC